MADPTALEQYFFELVNAERLRVGIQPVAWEPALGQAADDHNTWLLANDRFEHSPPYQTAVNAGFQIRPGEWGIWENHEWSANYPGGPQDQVDVHHAGYLSSPEHYAIIIDPNVDMAGIGFATGEFMGFQNAWVSTEYFAYNSREAFLLGVVYNDLNGDGAYDAGEGVGGIEIDITDSFGNLSHVYTMAAGGYNVEIGAGTYTVQFGEAMPVQVTLGGLNVKLDAVGPDFVSNPPPPPPPPPPDNTVYYQTGTGKGTTLTGHANADDVYTGRNGSDTFVWGGGNDTITDWQDAGKNQDILKIDDAIFFNFSDAMAHATQQGADVVFYENADTTMTLKNVTLAQLGADDFAFF